MERARRKRELFDIIFSRAYRAGFSTGLKQKNKYPEIKELKKIILYTRRIKPDLIIAVGGGSVIDYAKMANILNPEKNLTKQIINSDYGKIKKFTKLLAIPTTAGTGAEVTSNAVIYIGKIKFSVESELLKPNYFIIIPCPDAVVKISLLSFFVCKFINL